MFIFIYDSQKKNLVVCDVLAVSVGRSPMINLLTLTAPMIRTSRTRNLQSNVKMLIHLEAVAGLVVVAMAGPVVGPVAGPVVGPVAGPVVGTMAGLVVEAVAGLVVEAVAGLVVEAVAGLVVEAVAGLVVEAVAGLVVEAVAELIVEPQIVRVEEILMSFWSKCLLVKLKVHFEVICNSSHGT